MIISLVLVLFVTASGTVATYLYDEAASLAARLCAGACIGLAALGLVGFVIASLLGLTPLAIVTHPVGPGNSICNTAGCDALASC